METVNCPSCGSTGPAAALLCGVCGWSLDVLPTVAMRPEATGPASEVEDPSAECPTCGQQLSPDDSSCPVCSSPVSAAATQTAEIVAVQVVLPGGLVVTVRDGENVEFGRAVDRADVSVSLAPYDGVSRVHATIGLRQGRQLEVSDLQSTNGTFVDDIQVQGVIRVPANRSMSIRLGRGAAMTVSPIHHSSRGNA